MWNQRWKEAVQVVEVAVPVGAGLLAAATRFAADWLYGSYGVTSDEVGLSVPSLVLQSAAVAVGVAVVVVAVGVAFVVIWRSALLRSLAFLAIGIAGGFATDGWRPSDAFSSLVGSGILLWISFTLSPTRGRAGAEPTTEQEQQAGRRGRQRVVRVTAAVVAVGLVFVNLALANEARLLIDAGEPATYAIGPVQAIGFRAPVVEVYGLAEHDVPDGSCAHLFGRAHGVTVLRTAGRVVRAPTEQAMLRSSSCVVPDG